MPRRATDLRVAASERADPAHGYKAGVESRVREASDAAELPEEHSAWWHVFKPGLRAVKRYWPAVLLIQMLGLALVISYNLSPGLREALRGIEEVKRQHGLLYAFVSAALATSLLPELAKSLTRRADLHGVARWRSAAYTGLVLGTNGVFVYAFYELQNRMFGSSNDLLTLVIKTSVDMFVASVLVFIPFSVGMFLFRDLRFDVGRFARALSRGFMRNHVMPILPSTWAYWIPMLMLLYSLPIDLQFAFSVLANAAWSLLFVFMVRRRTGESVGK